MFDTQINEVQLLNSPLFKLFIERKISELRQICSKYPESSEHILWLMCLDKKINAESPSLSEIPIEVQPLFLLIRGTLFGASLETLEKQLILAKTLKFTYLEVVTTTRI